MANGKKEHRIRLLAEALLWLVSWGLLLLGAVSSLTLIVLFRSVFMSEQTKALFVGMLFGAFSIASSVFLARVIYTRELVYSKGLVMAKKEGLSIINGLEKCRFRWSEFPIDERKAISTLRKICVLQETSTSNVVACFLAMTSGLVTIITIFLADETLVKDEQLSLVFAFMMGVMVFVAVVAYVVANMRVVSLIRKANQSISVARAILKRHRFDR